MLICCWFVDLFEAPARHCVTMPFWHQWMHGQPDGTRATRWDKGPRQNHEGPERTAGIVSAGNLQAICRHSQFMESKLLLTELSEHNFLSNSDAVTSAVGGTPKSNSYCEQNEFKSFNWCLDSLDSQFHIKSHLPCFQRQGCETANAAGPLQARRCGLSKPNSWQQHSDICRLVTGPFPAVLVNHRGPNRSFCRFCSFRALILPNSLEASDGVLLVVVYSSVQDQWICDAFLSK